MRFGNISLQLVMHLVMFRSKMNYVNLLVVAVCFISLVTAYPQIRIKRSGISDQRVAELETLLVLNQIKNSDGTQVAYGIFDPQEIGRKKRSVNENVRTTGTSFILQKLFDIAPRKRTSSTQSSLQTKRDEKSSINKLLHKINSVKH